MYPSRNLFIAILDISQITRDDRTSLSQALRVVVWDGGSTLGNIPVYTYYAFRQRSHESPEVNTQS